MGETTEKDKKESFAEMEKDVAQNIKMFNVSSNDIKNVLEVLVKGDVYEKLDAEEQVKHDLFISYAMTSLFWMFTRINGEDPVAKSVKTETDRVQEYMKKYQKVKDRKSAPKLDKGAAKRFVKSGLSDPKNAPSSSNKRKTFDDDD